jgi:ring-1,2-phenylacetyl-CoA epoxidase subunit PaaA
VPQAELLGITLPDTDLKFDETSQTWLHGAINWDEFWQVVGGDGPCNRERLETRRAAVEQGEWVREAAAANALKQANRRKQQVRLAA